MDASNDIKSESGEVVPKATLQRSQDLMKLWDTMQDAIKETYPSEKLNTELIGFRKTLFDIMQSGFQSRETELKSKLVGLINTCLASESKCQCWKDLRDAIDDYMRLGTAETFSTEEQQVIQKLGNHSLRFWRLGFHCNFDWAQREGVAFRFVELVND